MTTEEIQKIYDYSKSKQDIIKKLNINPNQNGINLDKDILKYFSLIDIQIDDLKIENLKKHWLDIQKRDYNLNPKYCLWCGKQLPFEKRKSKCCNQSCATSYSNTQKGSRSEETKNKIRESCKQAYLNGTFIPHNQYTCPTSKKYNINAVNKIRVESTNVKKTPKYFKLLSDLLKDNEYNKYCLNLDNYEYKEKYVNIKSLQLHTCSNCGKEFYRRITKFGNFVKTKQCCDKCQIEYNRKTSKENVQKRIENGTFKGWQSRNILSYPEKFWTKVLENNKIDFIPNKPVKQENNMSCYFLDFYIEKNGRKIDLEIDGKQHKYKDRQESDKKRDKYLKLLGYEVYRIEWNTINKKSGKELMKEKIDKFIKYYNNINDLN